MKLFLFLVLLVPGCCCHRHDNAVHSAQIVKALSLIEQTNDRLSISENQIIMMRKREIARIEQETAELNAFLANKGKPDAE